MPSLIALHASSEASAKEEGKPADIDGYYLPADQKASAALRPSGTFNQILASL